MCIKDLQWAPETSNEHGSFPTAGKLVVSLVKAPMHPMVRAPESTVSVMPQSVVLQPLYKNHLVCTPVSVKSQNTAPSVVSAYLCKLADSKMFLPNIEALSSHFSEYFQKHVRLQLTTSLDLMHMQVNHHLITLDKCICFRVPLLVVWLSILNLTTHSITSQLAKWKLLAYTFAFELIFISFFSLMCEHAPYDLIILSAIS